ncbi:MFS transporter [Latilactobacillus fuchuensis]|uniref:Oligogalacturonide transporter, MFS family n=1 Tax=Latilactobacillus fuchuensis TaxID=164393 RepID=A0A2N9DUU0_9LACO|nr:MFS transporter [Latilactobacillus fuchuensis]SPC37980.1 Oligogalacturonide transporter, MFS family [Latilactobacillus fuchuensis]
MVKKRKITLLTRLAYGSGNLLGSGALAISGAWLLFFYTTFCGLSVIKASLIFSIATYLDVILNPLMGFITDGFYQTKLGKRFGRRRFFILLGIPLMLIYPALWVTGMDFFYYLLTYVCFEMTYTMVMIPYETLAVEMTSDFDERTYLTGYKAMFGKVANFLGAALPGIFFGLLGKNSPYSFLATGTVYCVIMVAALTFLYFNSWEKSASEVTTEHVKNVWEAIKKLFTDILSTFRIKTFRHHMGMYLFGFGAEWLFTATFTYFIVFVLQRPSTFVSEMNSMSSILQLISTAIFIVICAKKGFTKPFSAALMVVILSVISYSLVYFLHIPHLTWLVVGITAIFGIGTGGVYYIPWTVYTFLADVDEVVTNRRREGVYSGAMTMAGKLIRATIVFILGIVLSQFGFKEGATVQPTSAVHAILGVLLIGVCGLALLGIYSSHKMQLNHETHKIILDELDRIHAGGKMTDVTPRTRSVVEELTGFKYEECFGNNTVGYHEKVEDHQDPIAH